jgi:hypothetical protein
MNDFRFDHATGRRGVPTGEALMSSLTTDAPDLIPHHGRFVARNLQGGISRLPTSRGMRTAEGILRVITVNALRRVAPALFGSSERSRSSFISSKPANKRRRRGTCK